MSLDPRRPRSATVPAVFAVAGTLLLGLVLVTARPAVAAAPAELSGTFRIAAGRCAGAPTGSYFRMILPSGTLQGPWIDNADSACGDRTYTLLAPGTDGGLVTGTYQPAPKPGFDGDGNSLAVRLIEPVRFFGVDFSASTEPTDLQTGVATPAPVLRHDAGRLSGELPGFAATWNKQAFNQGSPKPDGDRPGLTGPVTGSFDVGSGAFVLTWTTQIVGGPFDGFTGLWHLEGTFVPASTDRATPAAAAAADAAAGGKPGVPVASEEPADPMPEVAAPQGAVGPDVAPVVAGSTRAVRVDDNGFSAPVWLVVALAATGIAGVVVLLVAGRRIDEVPA